MVIGAKSTESESIMNKKLRDLEKNLGLIGYIGPKGLIQIILTIVIGYAYFYWLAKLILD